MAPGGRSGLRGGRAAGVIGNCSACKLKGTPAAEQFPGRSASAAIFKAARKFFERPTAAPENFRGLLFARPSPTREAAAGPNAPCGERDASDISLGTRGAALKSIPQILPPPCPRSARVAANSGEGASRPGEETPIRGEGAPEPQTGCTRVESDFPSATRTSSRRKRISSPARRASRTRRGISKPRLPGAHGPRPSRLKALKKALCGTRFLDVPAPSRPENPGSPKSYIGRAACLQRSEYGYRKNGVPDRSPRPPEFDD